jgi:hypothetical protein
MLPFASLAIFSCLLSGLHSVGAEYLCIYFWKKTAVFELSLQATMEQTGGGLFQSKVRPIFSSYLLIIVYL